MDYEHFMTPEELAKASLKHDKPLAQLTLRDIEAILNSHVGKFTRDKQKEHLMPELAAGEMRKLIDNVAGLKEDLRKLSERVP